MPIEILTDAQKRVLARLSRVLKDTDFYLAGGTALALHLGHRMSQDFDWFIPRMGETEKLLTLLSSHGIEFTVMAIDIETCYVMIENIQVSFLRYDYPLLQPPILFPEYGVPLASLDDISAMKLAAIASRGARKDFVDLYFLFQTYRPLEDCLNLYQKKFESRDIGHVIRSLVYFENAELEPEVMMTKPLSWDKLKKDMEQWVKGLKL
jgi:predicted nucleotidyltransferase component of viral defense system